MPLSIKLLLMRIKAFSLLEMTLALLLSSIVVAMAVSAYLIVSKKIDLYKHHLSSVEQLSTLQTVMLIDFENAKTILNKNEYLSFLSKDSNEVIYKFDNTVIIRKQAARIDSFFVNYQELLVSEEPALSKNNQVINKVSFTTNIIEPIEMKFFKKYSAADIINYGRN